MEHYFGKKGYSVKKSSLTSSQCYEIRSELTMKPNNQMNGFVSNVTFPIYRESNNKFYLPRYYGIEKFGPYNRSLIPQGHDIDIEFNGSLFPYQDNIISKFINFVGEGGGGLLDVEPGKGKTVMGLNIISKLKKKTLVIVHKSFLLNQWKERIEQFLPNAKVGSIQGQTIDVEGKDIVIGMLQTLCTKTFDEDIISQFGLTIYDECHHLSAEVFSNVMNNIITNYCLGLSGTMTRKDGLTKVFKYFIGPVVHKEKSDNKVKVTINTILFEDPENDIFNKVETDFKGNPMYSRMITKLCENRCRSSMIVNVIHYEIKRDPEQQIMILAHNKNLIHHLYEEIQRFEPSIGLYLGGMKENQLKESESKKVIIATYAMASEGLDIKTLTTLLMATPKSDVCQSIGRILRSKHANPLVIDIVDIHDIFRNQYNKRKAYYKKKEYVIHKYLNLNNYLEQNFTVEDLTKKQNKIKIKKPVCLINIQDNAS